MNNIQVFQNEQFGQVRVVEHNGEPWFVTNDVCKALEITNPRNVIARLDEDEKGVHSMDTLGGKQTMTTINEPGLYTLVLNSRKPEAKTFKRWITHDVIPSIRKHGAYMTDITLEKMMSDPREMAKLLTALADERDQRIALEHKNAEQQKLIAEYKPKVIKYDTILDSDALIAATTIAKSCGFTSAIKLNRFLHEQGIQYKHGDVWELYSKYSGNGYMSSYHFEDRYGKVRVSNAWTPKGYMFLCDNVFKPNGIEPASVEATLAMQSEDITA